MDNDSRKVINEVLTKVYSALEEKGYDPIGQLTGYLLSGDRSYITSYKDAKYILAELERDDILEEVLRSYFGK